MVSPHGHPDVNEIVPGMLVGAKAVVDWLLAIGISANTASLRKVTLRSGAKTKVSLNGIHTYDQAALVKIVREYTKVNPACWIASVNERRMLAACQPSTGGPAAMEVDRKEAAKNTTNPLYVVLVPLTGRERNQETVLVQRDTGRVFVTRYADTASAWDVSWWPGPWRILRYMTSFPALSPTKDPRAKRPIRMSNVSLLSAQYLDEASGVIRSAKIPANMLGWKFPTEIACIFAVGNRHTMPIAKYVQWKYRTTTVWWWLWASAMDVRPVTLDPIGRNHLRSEKIHISQMPLDGTIDDGRELLSELGEEPGEKA